MNTVKTSCGNCRYYRNGQCGYPLNCSGVVYTTMTSRKTMTNRQWLNTLSNEEFTSVVLEKVSEFEENNFDPGLDIFDISCGTRIDFEEWLGEEHKEQ